MDWLLIYEISRWVVVVCTVLMGLLDWDDA